MAEIPSVKVLEALNPQNAGTGEDVLVYGGLTAAVENYRLTNPGRSAAVWNAEIDSMQEESKARQLAFEYLLRNSDKVVSSHEGNRDLWADRFTQASIELYGQPELSDTAHLMHDAYNSFIPLRGQGNVSQSHLETVLAAYYPGAVVYDANPNLAANIDTHRERQAVRRYGEVLKRRYQPIFDMVDATGKERFTPQDLGLVFTDALDWLTEHDDSAWGEWAAIPKEGTSLSVSPKERRIKIADRREPATVAATKGLLAHELLVHAARAKNGFKTGDQKLGLGLPGYADSEEGLGVLAEHAINGVLPEKAGDRYTDIAMALGTVEGVQRTRHQLFEVAYPRSLVRAQTRGETTVDTANLANEAWVHVDRIYRGGLGDDRATHQAVFTKDIVYYRGYRQMVGFLADRLDAGYTAEAIYDYLIAAKFDPYNKQHVSRVEAAGVARLVS
jgi:hypothetical protein